jgi:uncharacterized protein (DUF58 family)
MSGRAPLIACIAVLAFFAGITGVRLAYTLAYVLAFMLLLAFAWSRAVARRVSVTRESPSGVFMVGEPFTERFTVTNRGLLPIAYCEVRDATSLPGYLSSRALSLNGGGTVTWNTRGVFARRGVYGFGPVHVRLGDPFGLFPRTVRVDPGSSVTVYPAIHAVGEIGPLSAGGSGGDVRRGRPVDMPPEVAAVREYDPADGMGRIHWPSTARAGRLMSRVYDTRQSSDLLVVLDLERGHSAGMAPESSVEYAISLAASICHAGLRRGQAVGLVTNDARHTAIGAGRGEAQRLRLLDYLATAEDDGGTGLAETVRRHGEGWRGRGGIVVITSSRGREWIEALLEVGTRGVRHLAVVVEPTSFGAAGPPIRVLSAWRLALDWWLVRRGDDLDAGRRSRAAAL